MDGRPMKASQSCFSSISMNTLNISVINLSINIWTSTCMVACNHTPSTPLDHMIHALTGSSLCNCNKMSPNIWLAESSCVKKRWFNCWMMAGSRITLDSVGIHTPHYLSTVHSIRVICGNSNYCLLKWKSILILKTLCGLERLRALHTYYSIGCLGGIT